MQDGLLGLYFRPESARKNHTFPSSAHIGNTYLISIQSLSIYFFYIPRESQMSPKASLNLWLPLPRPCRLFPNQPSRTILCPEKSKEGQKQKLKVTSGVHSHLLRPCCSPSLPRILAARPQPLSSDWGHSPPRLAGLLASCYLLVCPVRVSLY